LEKEKRKIKKLTENLEEIVRQTRLNFGSKFFVLEKFLPSNDRITSHHGCGATIGKLEEVKLLGLTNSNGGV